MGMFVVSGRFEARDGYQEFEKTLEAPNEDVAVERAYADVGSRHGLKRTRVEIDDVAEAEVNAA